jgi:hypothetical protein
MHCDALVSLAQRCPASISNDSHGNVRNETSSPAIVRSRNMLPHDRSADMMIPACNDGQDTGAGFPVDAQHCGSQVRDSVDSSETHRCNVAGRRDRSVPRAAFPQANQGSLATGWHRRLLDAVRRLQRGPLPDPQAAPQRHSARRWPSRTSTGSRSVTHTDIATSC